MHDAPRPTGTARPDAATLPAATPAAPQWLALEGVANARDIGGLALIAGGTTRSGVLIRSDAVHELTGPDVTILVERFGVRHVVDLRAAGERSMQPRGRLAAAGVRTSELAVISDDAIAARREAREQALLAGADIATVIGDGYVQLLEIGRDAFVGAIERLVDDDGAPAIVHCSAGKDRTGVLVALLLEVAGVEREAIVADYAATDARMADVRARLADMPLHAQLVAEAAAPLLAAHRVSMERFLDRLGTEAGGARAWFRAAGVPERTLDRWRDLLSG